MLQMFKVTWFAVFVNQYLVLIWSDSKKGMGFEVTTLLHLILAKNEVFNIHQKDGFKLKKAQKFRLYKNININELWQSKSSKMFSFYLSVINWVKIV